MILEKQKDGWWIFDCAIFRGASKYSDLDAVLKALCGTGEVDEPLADEIYAVLARNRNCENCKTDCPDNGLNKRWGCSDWTRRNS